MKTIKENHTKQIYKSKTIEENERIWKNIKEQYRKSKDIKEIKENERKWKKVTNTIKENQKKLKETEIKDNYDKPNKSKEIKKHERQ